MGEPTCRIETYGAALLDAIRSPAVPITGLTLRSDGEALVVTIEVAGRAVEVLRTYAPSPILVDQHVTGHGLRRALARAEGR